MANFYKRDIEFLFEIGSLRNVERGWKQHLAVDCASDLEHSFRVAFFALILARREGVKNEEKIIKMALVHDLAETRTSDLSYVQKVYVSADEARAAEDLFDGTSLGDLNKNILHEFEARESIEAKIVKDADNLDIDLELKELEERGSKLPKKWGQFRKKVRDEKLYTQSAKKFWDELQKRDVASWHLNANKWLKIPHAGK
ncbi:MAG: putative hydrolases of HD superfamily [Parcubacteria group bacterium Gr01-1014_33]|nr:MAG: putative hydrolases of HD superfamily [Parcubacteria group bacterium Gr01-1014_33]